MALTKGPQGKTLVTVGTKYLELVQKSKLVDAKPLAAAVEQLQREHGGQLPADSRVLARRLVDLQLLTPWQNWHLLEGRFRGFVLGRYKLLSYISGGGMSRVYLAEHLLLKRRVALKLLAESNTGDTFRLRRFYLESEASAALTHPNIVCAYDFDQDGKFHFLIMEYVEGQDLQRLVGKHGPLAYDLAAEYIAQAAHGLSYAHQRHMIHRDIKPANLMVDKNGTVKILDLGVVRLTTQTDASLTVEQGVHIIGTVDYLPPEQFLDGHNVDARADLYSLGCTLYYVLTGHPPFCTGNQSQRIMLHQTEPPPSILLDRPDAPPGLVGICERLLAKDPADRFQTAAEVNEVLQKWVAVYRSGGDWHPDWDSETRSLALPLDLNVDYSPAATAQSATNNFDKNLNEPPSDEPVVLPFVTRSSSRPGSSPTPVPCGPPAPASLPVRLKQVFEQLLASARAGRKKHLVTLVESFVLPEPTVWFARLCGLGSAQSATKEYKRRLPHAKSTLLRRLLDLAPLAAMTVEIREAELSPRDVPGVLPDTGVKTPLRLFTVRLKSADPEFGTATLGPFVHVADAFRLLPMGKQAA